MPRRQTAPCPMEETVRILVLNLERRSPSGPPSERPPAHTNWS